MDDHDFAKESLGDYLDGSLDPVERARLDRHLTACSGCAVDLAWFAELRERARRLPPEIAPPHDLWPGIAARIAPTAARPGSAVLQISSRRSVSPRRLDWRWSAAAAVLLVAISSGATAYVLRGGSGELPSAVTETRIEATAPVVGLAAFEPAEEEYRYTVDLLETEFAARRDRLLPETISAVESNLVIIDEAIAEARAALAANPISADLPLLLSAVYRRKVELLRSAVDIPARS